MNYPEIKKEAIKAQNSVRKTGILKGFRICLNRNKVGEALVIRGSITPKQLRAALDKQKQSNQRLGQILVHDHMVTRGELAFVLGRQVMVRTIMTLAFCVLSLTAVPMKKAHAGTNKTKTISKTVHKRAAQVSAMGNTRSSYRSIHSYPNLLGTKEQHNRDIKEFTKWTGMFDRFEREMSGSASQKVMKDLHKNLAAYEGLSIKSMAIKVNKLMNQKRYVTDKHNWGKSDYWATPVQFMQRGGDCEDFAIAKYNALRSLGVPEDRMRLAIVQDKNANNIVHAVLVVYTDEGPYILDNQIKTLVDASKKGRYRPIFSINRTSWWLHSAPEKTRVASLH